MTTGETQVTLQDEAQWSEYAYYKTWKNVKVHDKANK